MQVTVPRDRAQYAIYQFTVVEVPVVTAAQQEGPARRAAFSILPMPPTGHFVNGSTAYDYGLKKAAWYLDARIRRRPATARTADITLERDNQYRHNRRESSTRRRNVSCRSRAPLGVAEAGTIADGTKHHTLPHIAPHPSSIRARSAWSADGRWRRTMY